MRLEANPGSALAATVSPRHVATKRTEEAWVPVILVVQPTELPVVFFDWRVSVGSHLMIQRDDERPRCVS